MYRGSAGLWVPKVERFEPSPDGAGVTDMQAVLIGQNLETIEKLGWSAGQSEPVATLPLPFAADSSKQELQVRIPRPPDAQASLLVWLRGESQPRSTRVHLRMPLVGPPPAGIATPSGTR